MQFAHKILLILFCFILFACSNEKTNKSKIDKKQNIKTVPKTAVSSDSNPSTNNELSVPQKQIEKAMELLKQTSPNEIAAVDAAKKYKVFCAVCHGFKGNSNINGAKDLTKSKISLEESIAQVYYGKGLMTPFNGIMKDAEIIAVSQYVEKLRN